MAALALAAGACGGDDEQPPAAQAGNGTDAAFASEMIPHHQSAVLMAQVAAERAESRFVAELAADIRRTQTQEIAVLRRERQALAGVEPAALPGAEHGDAMHEDAHALQDADPFDRRFLEQMIPHHESAIEMAEAELAAGRDPELRELAKAIAAAQRREIDSMREHLDAAAAGGEDGGGHGGHSDAHGEGYPG